jgi:hypothetical protein
LHKSPGGCELIRIGLEINPKPRLIANNSYGYTTNAFVIVVKRQAVRFFSGLVNELSFQDCHSTIYAKMALDSLEGGWLCAS